MDHGRRTSYALVRPVLRNRWAEDLHRLQ